MIKTNILIAKISYINNIIEVDDILSVSPDNSPLYEFQNYLTNELQDDFKLIVESAAEHNNINFDSNQDFTCLLKVSWNYELDHEHIDNSELYFYDFIVLSLGE